MRADRLLSILLLLQVHRRVTAADLAGRLEVSPRTIYRDMEALSAAGVPVYAERGYDGGWRLLEEYETRLTGLNQPEIQALFLQPAGLLADLGLDKASDSALIKLLAALPAMRRDSAEFVRQRIHIDGAGWRQPAEDLSFLPILQDAVWQERQVLLAYRRADEQAVERRIDPLGLVAKGRVWYLVAGVEGELRTYRVSRVQAAHVLDAPCVRPTGFDLATYWDASVAQFRRDLPRYQATVRVPAGLVPRLRDLRFTQVLDVGAPDAAGWVTVLLQFETQEEACEYALGFGPRMEVLEPGALRDQVVAMARATVALYQGAQGD